MANTLEYGYTSLNKSGEELCGDNVAIKVSGNYTTIVLADGLGSGVKANILSTITSKILCTMISNHISIEECLETVIQTLPTCKERGLSYSTFSVIHISNDCASGHLFEFDNPQAICLNNGTYKELERKKLLICDRVIYETPLHLVENDIVLIMSDGVPHAGIGKVLNFGWQRDDIIMYLKDSITTNMSARASAALLASASNDLYVNSPGDDTTVAAIKVRKRLDVNIMVGPPVDKERDNEIVGEFFDGETCKVVCGGTSSQIVSRYLNKPIKTTIDFPDPTIPPIGYIEGVDLVTEGVITLRKLVEMSDNYLSPSDLTPKTFKKRDGASLLADMLFERATHINFFVGQGVNQAHIGMPIDTTMKLKLIETISHNLTSMGKVVNVKYD